MAWYLVKHGDEFTFSLEGKMCGVVCVTIDVYLH
jgi:hypothetical protein